MLELASFNPAVPERDGAERRALLAKVHVARKHLGIFEDDYRELLRRTTGRSSARDCTVRQLEQMMREFARLGFRPRSPTTQRRRGEKQASQKVRAMWISLHQLGVIADPSELALAIFAKRQLGVERLQWADQSQAFRLIEALKAMAERHGWKQAVPAHLQGEDRIRWLKDQLIAAQIAKLPVADRASLGAGAYAEGRASWTIEQMESASGALSLLLQDREAKAS